MKNEASNYKATLTITSTDFPQKAKLNENEPARLLRWKEIGLESLIEKKGKSPIASAEQAAGTGTPPGSPRPKYVLHDGPPYANGDIHLGHALNKALKDIVVRYKTMRGFYSRFVPGYDCHGLPIEQKVIEGLGQDEKNRSQLEIRKACHQFATKYIGLQSEQFQRLGVGGAWDTPYLTLSAKYEVGILTALREMVARGCVYKGFKPVYWDPKFRTALAEAEIEYEEHTSPSIYVRFPVLNPEDCPTLAPFAHNGDQSSLAHDPLPETPPHLQSDIAIVIWTTTPWTLPGNLAVAVHPEFDYVLFETSGEKMIAAEALLEAFQKEAGLPEVRILTRFKGTALEGLKCSHPLLEKHSQVVLGTHVTLEQGTGCVHTAPAHGIEDFEVCSRYGIEVVVPVDERGCFNGEYPDMEGVFVWTANPKIVEVLRKKGLLVWSGKVTHQYAYSWRSHEPTIVRATHQWFMKLDHDGIRQKCLNAIMNQVQWVPSWARERIFAMVQGRPDWCLSRQRSWGVPIPALYSVSARQSILCVEVVDRFIELVAQHGTNCWFEMPVEAFVPKGFKCPISGGTGFEKEYDILDVWFEAGSSHIAVLEQDEDLASPADMYLEGSDQHRGWFNASLFNSMAVRNRAPFKTVLTHGFILDGNGLAMHKSKGNVISPLTIIQDMGADVLRLWVISEDYRTDITASEAIFNQMREAYRRIRNTLRFMLGNLTDFNPEADSMPPAQRDELDRWALACAAELVDKATQAYETCEFHRIYHLVHQFCVVTMSALYLDILKDRLYCAAPNDHVRRSAQSAVWDIFSALTRLLAPMMPFTSDEAWSYGHPRQPSVHLEDFPIVPASWRDGALVEKWERFQQIREIVMRPMEELRREKTIGKSLDAAVTLRPHTRELARFLTENAVLLRDFFIVSYLNVDAGAATEEGPFALDQDLQVQVAKAPGEKCARCWTFSTEVGADQEHPQLCRRCAGVVRRLP